MIDSPFSVSFYADEQDALDASDLTWPGKVPRQDPAQPQQHQDITILQSQIAKNNEKLDFLTSMLNECEAVNEAIEAEKMQLINELAQARKTIEEQPAAASSTPPRRFSLFGSGAPTSNGGSGSMQLLVNTNARLSSELDRLEIANNCLRKTFQSYIKRRNDSADKELLEKLKRENEQLRQELESSQEKVETSERTFETCASTHVEEPQEDAHDTASEAPRIFSKHRELMMRMFESNKKVTKEANSKSSSELLVEFGETSRRRRGFFRTRRTSL